MTLKAKLLFALFLIVSFALRAQGTDGVELFDDNWLFYRGAAQGADDSAFADRNWKKVNLPHDWSIEDIPGTKSPFSVEAVSQVSGGFTVGGTGWYRKSFSVAETQKGKRHFI